MDSPFQSSGREESERWTPAGPVAATEACRQNARRSGEGGLFLGWGVQGDFLAEVAGLGP